MDSILVVGPGALGLLFAARFAEAGRGVTLLDHRADRAERLSRSGIVLQRGGQKPLPPVGDSQREGAKRGDGGSNDTDSNRVNPHPNPPPQGEGIQTGEGIRLPVITERTADTPDFDAILFLTKSMSTRAAAERAKPFQSPQTVAVTLQNGIGNAEVLAEVFGAENVLVGTTREGATLLEEGVARYAGTGATRVGAMRPARIEDAHLFVKLLTDCGFEAEYADDWESAVWLKAILNAAINPLTALLGVANGKLAEWDSAREVMLSLARECVAVAKARGINLPDSSDDSVDEMVVDVCRRSATNRSSMLQDLDNGRRTELEFFNGVILREAERLRLDTPTLRTVTLLARAREQATLSSGGTP